MLRYLQKDPFNREENKTIGALSSVSLAEYRSGIKAAAWTLETKMVMYSISSKLNTPFSTIGKATADKITATRLGENARFRFRVNNQFEDAVCAILNTFVLLDKSLLPHLG